MKRTIEFDDNAGICVIKVSGIHKRPEDSLELLRFAGDFAREHDCSRFMFDMRDATVFGSTTGAYKTVTDSEKYGFSRCYRVAAVYPTLNEDHKFMENVGMNRGSVGFKVFDDFDKAREWIMSI